MTAELVETPPVDPETAVRLVAGNPIFLLIFLLSIAALVLLFLPEDI